VKSAARAILDARLKRILSYHGAAALFLPRVWRDPPKLGFTSEELDVRHASVPPTPHSLRPAALPTLLGERFARAEEVAQQVRGLEGCLAAAVLHYGGAVIVTRSGEVEPLALVWSLGASLNELGDDSADAIACSGTRCHVGRRMPGDPDCFVYAAFDLSLTSLALARRSFALTLARAS
jgi:hypothetical protein